MSVPAWTPGPWGFGNTASYERLILGEGGGGRYVCHVTIEQIGGGFIAQSMEAEREANARLLAAAPDLVEAAIFALKFIDQMNEEWSVGDEEAAALRAALAKAGAA